MKETGKKPFTLAELLIIIAIIAAVITIAIPVLSNYLERKREAADADNLKAAYEEVVAQGLSSGASNSLTVTAKQTDFIDWENQSLKDGKIVDVDIPDPAASWTVTYSAATERVTITPNL